MLHWTEMTGGGIRVQEQIRRSTAQQIVEAVRDVCGCDVNFIDRDGVIFASTDPERTGTCHEAGRRAAESGETVEIAADQEAGWMGVRRGVNLPFFYRGECIGAIGITGDPESVRRYGQLAQKITALILREHELEEQSRDREARLGCLIRALTRGEPLSHEYFQEMTAEYGLNEEDTWHTVLVRTQAGSPAERAVRDMFRSTGSPLFCSAYPGEHTLILTREQLQKSVSSLRSLAESWPSAVKIGAGCGAPLREQSRSFRAAGVALSSLFGEQNLAFYDQLCLELLLGTVPEEARSRFLEKTVGDLSERDRKVLEAYFSSNLSLKAAGEVLYMHKNTLQYQLDRIWRETGLNPRNFQDAAVLYLGLRLLPR